MGPSYVWDPQWADFSYHYDRDEAIHRAAAGYPREQGSRGHALFRSVSYHAPHTPLWIPAEIRDRFHRRDLDLPAIPPDVDTCHGPMDA